MRLNLKTRIFGVYLAALRRDQCDEYQSYLFSKPVAVEQFEALIAENHPIRTG